MKRSYVLLMASVLTLTMGTSIQAQDRMIDGVTVSSEQMDDVQIRCDELRAENEASATGTTASDTTATPAADAPAAGASDDAAATESPAEEPVAPDGATATDGGNMAAEGSDTLIDVGALTFELCQESGFYEASM